MTRIHEDELEVDERLVRELLATVSPAYDELPLRRFGSTGSTNALFRLGEELLVRVPRQPGGTSTIEKEQRWLPYVAPAVPVDVPEVVAVGEPAAGYPEKWSVVRFLPGVTPEPPVAGEQPRHALARDLAAVVTGLRALPVTAEARSDPSLRWYRGGPLAALDHDVRQMIRDCRQIDGLELDLDLAARTWDSVLELPAAHEAGEPRWHHGDLLAENLLVNQGRLSAVLDFGGLSVGNPAVDLVVAWELLDPAARRTFRELVGASGAEWELARGWAFVLTIMVFPYYWHTLPRRCATRLGMAQAIFDELWPGALARASGSAGVAPDDDHQHRHDDEHGGERPAVEPESVSP